MKRVFWLPHLYSGQLQYLFVRSRFLLVWHFCYFQTLYLCASQNLRCWDIRNLKINSFGLQSFIVALNSPVVVSKAKDMSKVSIFHFDMKIGAVIARKNIRIWEWYGLAKEKMWNSDILPPKTSLYLQISFTWTSTNFLRL